MDQTYFFWVGVACGVAVTTTFAILLFALLLLAEHRLCEEQYLTAPCKIQAVPVNSQIIPP